MTRTFIATLVSLLAMLLSPPLAADTFMDLTVADLELADGVTLSDQRVWSQPWWFGGSGLPYVVLDVPGEAYIHPESRATNQPGAVPERRLVLRLPDDRPVTGRLFIAPWGDEQGQAVRFTITGDHRNADSEAAFFETKYRHYERMLQFQIPGAAWFRHEANAALDELRRIKPDTAAEIEVQRNNRGWGWRGDSMQRSLALVTGGMAVAENLQLDRDLNPGGDGEGSVELTMITGITVRDFDWASSIAGKSPRTDVLADRIPEDQHAMFFGSFTSMLEMMDYAGPNGGPLAQMFETRAEAAGVFERYQRQFAMPVTALTRALGPRVIKSVALTGGDPYFRTGTDVAILFETSDAASLMTMLMATREAAIQAERGLDVERISGEIGGLTYDGRVSADRTVCTYLATLDTNAVIATNSLAQIERLAAVRSGQTPDLVSLPEYTFFRDRYPLEDDSTGGFLMISDKTIRRWCGPRWRIATSRRTRALGNLMDLQAEHLDALVRDTVTPGPIESANAFPAPDGPVHLTKRGVHSEAWGTLGFVTPISELDFDVVSKVESDSYEQWRRGYESAWRAAFDPIGGVFAVDGVGPTADITVMPLIAGTQYDWMSEMSRNVAIAPEAGDPDADSMIHGVFAINREWETLRMMGGMIMPPGPGPRMDPFGWLGESVAIYVEADPIWKAAVEAATEAIATGDDPDEFLQEKLDELPVLMHMEVNSGIKLAGFLAAARGVLESVAPGMFEWENDVHNGTDYVRIVPSEKARRQEEELKNLRVCYVAGSSAFIVSLSEEALKRAIDRQAKRDERPEGAAAPVREQPWLGESFCFQADERILPLLELMYGNRSGRNLLQVASWNNLPILNEWKRRYPDLDPVAVHATFWAREPMCPGGGVYRWNQDWQTVESTTYGHPGAKKDGPVLPAVLQQFEAMNTGLTFEGDGLRARIELTAKQDQ